MRGIQSWVIKEKSRKYDCMSNLTWPVHHDDCLLAVRSEGAEVASVRLTAVSSVRIKGPHLGNW